MTFQPGQKQNVRNLLPVLRRFIRIMNIISTGDHSIYEITKMTGYSRDVVRRYLKVIEQEIPEVKLTIVHQRRENGRGCTHKKIYRLVI